ncbi:hypothetical protein T08_11792 [Trichinella sp. T8]|nr:hypothetical protein T08_11792 [Trichinella sp. T8]
MIAGLGAPQLQCCHRTDSLILHENIKKPKLEMKRIE